MISINNLKEKSNIEFDIIFDSVFNKLGMVNSNLENAKILTFVSDSKFIESVLKNQSITSIITSEKIFNDNKEFLKNYGIIISDIPTELFFEIHNFLHSIGFYTKKSHSFIDPSSKIHNKVVIDEIGVEIGKNVLIEANVVIHSGVVINDNSIIRSGTILGSNGFQFLQANHEVISISSSGTLVIGKYVEIQHNCCIDKGVFGGITKIEDNVKIDNLVHIAHDCEIGSKTFLTAGVKLGGRTKIGENCYIGLNSTITNGINIGDFVYITMGSIVTKNIESNKAVINNITIDNDRYSKFMESLK